MEIPPAPYSLILGSSSKSRASILSNANIKFTVKVADIDEKAIGDRAEGSDPSSLVLQIARAKVKALFMKGLIPSDKPYLVIACDQVALWQGKIREKPTSEKEAREYLDSYSTAPAETVGATIVVNSLTGKSAEAVDVARQNFLRIPVAVIDSIIAQGKVYDCCGGFMIDDPLLKPYLGAREGDEDSIIGLSLRVLRSLISQVI